MPKTKLKKSDFESMRKKLIRRKELSGLSYRALAAEIHIEYTALFRYIKGKYVPCGRNEFLIRRYLDE